jgi:hypothetical protein
VSFPWCSNKENAVTENLGLTEIIVYVSFDQQELMLIVKANSKLLESPGLLFPYLRMEKYYWTTIESGYERYGVKNVELMVVTKQEAIQHGRGVIRMTKQVEISYIQNRMMFSVAGGQPLKIIQGIFIFGVSLMRREKCMIVLSAA